jgi:Fe-S cluster assembly iron-binding protein IscA
MLAMTQNAANAVERMVSQPEVPAGAVVRIVADDHRANGAGAAREVHLELVGKPRPRDLLVEEMRISVEPHSLAFLDDKVLDATVAEEGIEFTLYPQSGYGG